MIEGRQLKRSWIDGTVEVERAAAWHSFHQDYCSLVAQMKWRTKRPRTRKLLTQLEKGLRYVERGVVSAPLCRREYAAHRQTYMILAKRLDALHRHFLAQLPAIQCFPMEGTRSGEPTLCDEAEDVVDSLESELHELWRQDRLAVIELRDALARTDPGTLSIPERSKAFHYLNKAFVALTQATRDYLWRADVKQMHLSLGQYPPVEATRILNGAGELFTDALAIQTILQPGYQWKHRVIRKATVTVTTP